MTDFPLDDDLLVRLRAARPSIDPDELAPDGPAATALLEAILAGRHAGTGSVASRTPLVLLPPLPPAAPRPPAARCTPGGPLAHEAPLSAVAPATPTPFAVLRRGRSRRAMAVVGAAAVALVALVVAFSGPSGGRGHRAPVTSPTPPAAPSPVWRLEAQISPGAWQVAASAGGVPYALTCPTATTCYATGPSAPPPTAPGSIGPKDVVEVTHDGGASWHGSLVPAPGEVTGAATCPLPTTCMVAGSMVAGSSQAEQMYTTTDGGKTWSARPLPAVVVSSPHLSCWTTSDCLDVEMEPGPGGLGRRSIAHVTHDAGRTWSASVLPGTFRIAALTCGTAGDCVATGQAPPSYRVTVPSQLNAGGAVATTTDGGATWQESAVPPGAGLIAAVSCSGGTFCVALQYQSGPLRAGSRILASTDGGRRWSVTAGAGPDVLLSSVSCPTTRDCWAAGNVGSAAGGARGTGVFVDRAAVVTTTDGARTWHEEALPPAGATPLMAAQAISCAGPATCVALAEPTLGVTPMPTRAVVLRRGVPPANAIGSHPPSSPSAPA